MISGSVFSMWDTARNMHRKPGARGIRSALPGWQGIFIGYTIPPLFSSPGTCKIVAPTPALRAVSAVLDKGAAPVIQFRQKAGKEAVLREMDSRKVARLGVLFALALVLSLAESAIAPMLGLMPAMKLGLANIVVMYALLFLGRGQAYTLVVLKALFGFLTRGFTAGALSFLGGTLSFFVMCLLLLWPGEISGYLFSACGALAHNLGQLAGAAVLLSSGAALGYAPILMIAGLIVGGITWWILRALLPYFSRISPKSGKGTPYQKLR